MKKIYISIAIAATFSIANAQITELNYTNNQQAFSLHIGTPPTGIDLTTEAVTSPQHHVGSPSGNWDINFRVYNMGQGTTAPNSVAKIFVSTDNSYSVDDIFIKQENISQLNVGSYEEISSNIAIPAGFINGTYLFVIVRADADNLISELNENNNEQAFSLHIGTPPTGIDLTPEAVTSPQHHVGSPSGNWDINFRVYNMGQGTIAPNSVAKIYVSTDKYYSSNDIFIKQENVSQLNVGSFQEITSNISIPSGFSNGTYLYVIVVVNPDNVLGVNEFLSNRQFIIYPNPTSDQIVLDMNLYSTTFNPELVIIDNSGKIVFNEPLNNTKSAFSLKSLKPGLYNCFIKENNVRTESKKLIVH